MTDDSQPGYPEHFYIAFMAQNGFIDYIENVD